MKLYILFLYFFYLVKPEFTTGKFEDDFNTREKVVLFGNDVVIFFHNFLDQGKTPSESEKEQMVEEIKYRIGNSTESVIFDEKLPEFSDLRAVATTEKILLDNVKNIITALSKDKRDVYIQRYVEDFKGLKSTIYNLKDVQNFQGSIAGGVTKTFLTLVSEHFNCGLTDLGKVRSHYMMLVSNAVALDVLNEILSKTDLEYDMLLKWGQITVNLLSVFEDQANDCKRKFDALSLADFNKIRNTTVLFQNNQHRFSDKASDVLLLKGGQYCVKMLKDYIHILKRRDVRDTMTIAYFGKKEPATATEVKLFRKVAGYIRFESCKSDIKQLLPLFDVLGYDLEMMVIYLIKTSEHFELHRDTDSPVITELDDTSLYRILLYVRMQNENVTVYENDYETYFYDHTVPTSKGQPNPGTSSGCVSSIGIVVSIIIGAYFK